MAQTPAVPAAPSQLPSETSKAPQLEAPQAPSQATKTPVPTDALKQPAAVSSPAPGATTGGGTLNMPTEADREAAGQWKKKGAVGQSTFMDKLRTVTWALAFICFLIWLIGKFASKGTLEKLGLPADPDSLIEVLEKKRISPGRSVMLLRVGPKVLAVAVTESGFRTLTEIDSDSLKQHQDEHLETKVAAEPSAVAQGPSDVAKHYLSIIPGLGAKK
jgi:flagellar biogenesis protein FliO